MGGEIESSRRDSTPTAEDCDDGRMFLHVACVYFHHRNGPQIEYVYPSFPGLGSRVREEDTPDPVQLPKEWKFLPFMCLPDGAHAFREQFVYFHLPPVPEWNIPYSKTTLFGLSCCRSMPTDYVMNRTSDMTRNAVCKSVAVISAHPTLWFIKSKLEAVTKAFFNQKDFTNLDILKKMYQALNYQYANNPVEPLFYHGIRIVDFVNMFRMNILKLFKLLLLEKRVIFFGQDVEKTSLCQYALLSLLPRSVKCLYDSLSYEYLQDSDTQISPAEPDAAYSDDYGLPLRLFHKTSLFQPYLPLQKISSTLVEANSFIVGSSNKLALEESAHIIDVVVNTDTAAVNIVDKQLINILDFTGSDRKFAEAIVQKAAVSLGKGPRMEAIDNYGYYGSDDDIRKSFEEYIVRLLSLVYNHYSEETDELKAEGEHFNLSEFNMSFVEAWKRTRNHRTWYESISKTWRPNKVNVFDNIKPQHVTFSPSLIAAVQHNVQYRWINMIKNVRGGVNNVLHSSVQKPKPPPSPEIREQCASRDQSSEQEAPVDTEQVSGKHQ